MKSLSEVFPRASQAFLDANKIPTGPYPPIVKENESTGILARSTAKRGRMNKTEAEYAMILEAMKRKGEILRWEFEGITLRFAGVKYTPDFVVLRSLMLGECPIKLIEVKGPFIKGNRERAVERFRHAKTYWPEFTFEMHQKTKEGWRQLI